MTERVKIAVGHNNTGGLATFLVDPWTPRLIPGIVRASMSKKISEDGNRSTELRWGPKVPNEVNVDVRTKAGLTATTISGVNVTVRLPLNTNRDTWANFNGVAFMPEEAEFQRSGWEGLLVRILFLESI